jgi:transcriptional regulator with XRE-family HTH domain
MSDLMPLKGLTEKRKFRGMTQLEAGNILGVTQSHYRMFETGKVRLDIRRAKLLADAFGCTIDELL